MPFFFRVSRKGRRGGGSFLVFYGTFYDDVPSTSMVCFIRSCALSILLYCNTMPKYYCLIREGQYIQVLHFSLIHHYPTNSVAMEKPLSTHHLWCVLQALQGSKNSAMFALLLSTMSPSWDREKWFPTNVPMSHL